MNETRLSKLYRRLTSSGSSPLDAEDLAAAAEGSLTADRREAVAAALAASPAHADAFRALRDLKADSEALAAGVARTSREDTHRRRSQRDHRIAAGRRFGGVGRWAAAMAACLVAVLGVWTLRHPHTTMPPNSRVAYGTHDRIFDGTMDAVASQKPQRPDELFRGDFSGG
jgi:ferric-dicitrate binding protein FerR (iron transport regulator)